MVNSRFKLIRIILYPIILFILLGACYFIGFNHGQEREIANSKEEILKIQKNILAASETKKADNSINNQQTATKNSGAEQSEYDKNFQIYSVQDKDTLFTIGLKYDILWTKIAETNGIDENTPLFVGQKIKIPKAETAGSAEGDRQLSPEINQQEANAQQKSLNDSQIDEWRKDPLEVVRKEAPSDLNLAPGDPFTLISKDTNSGQSFIFLQKADYSYTFNLIQPVDKGDGGIWKINKIIIKKN